MPQVKELKELKLLVRQRRFDNTDGRYDIRLISAVAVF